MATPLNFQTILIMKKRIAIALLSFLTSNIAVLNAVLHQSEVKKTRIDWALSEMKKKVENGADINRSFGGHTFLTINFAKTGDWQP